MLCMFILLIVLIIVFVAIGTMQVSAKDVFSVIWSKIFDITLAVPANIISVVWEIRLPRILCSALAGAGLAVSGVIFQAILGNPLADPYTLGISTGAAFGASFAILLNTVYGFMIPVSPVALSFALLTLGLVIFTAGNGSGFPVTNLIISGIIVGSVLSSGISLIKMLAGESVSAIVFWLMGSFSAKKWDDIMILAPSIIVCCVIVIIFSEEMNILSLGDKSAYSLGLRVKRSRLMFLCLGSVMTAVSVSLCGVIGFVGLIIPHLFRMWVTADNRVLVPLSAFGGALLLLIADNATRIFTNGEIPVGIVTTMLGGPFFIWIFTRRKREAD